eukprot:10035088-Alexandrium_andersonii.AAC.1
MAQLQRVCPDKGFELSDGPVLALDQFVHPDAAAGLLLRIVLRRLALQERCETVRGEGILAHVKAACDHALQVLAELRPLV